FARVEAGHVYRGSKILGNLLRVGRGRIERQLKITLNLSAQEVDDELVEREPVLAQLKGEFHICQLQVGGLKTVDRKRSSLGIKRPNGAVVDERDQIRIGGQLVVVFIKVLAHRLG